ncbi:MAG TPA: hypothetical protein VFP97_12320, partial [Chitinophagaceae bacterium]|nr:hypothetical protein [Chitinophagaceae bacterium]
FSTGVIVSYHYCMDEFDSLQLGEKKADICGNCGMHTDDTGCCNNEVKMFKIQDDQQTVAVNFKFESPVAIIGPLPVWNETTAISTHQLFANNHSPPLSKQDTYLQNCVFRI